LPTTTREIDAEVRATADSGGIHVRRVNGPVYARADSGGIEAIDIAGSVDAEVDSGGVRVSQTTPALICGQTPAAPRSPWPEPAATKSEPILVAAASRLPM
jgi:hypothetical protein